MPVEEIKTEVMTAVETEAASARKVPAKKMATKEAPAKTTVAKKESVKEGIVKKETTKREAEKKEVKAPAKKTTIKKAEPRAEVHFQFDEKDLVVKDVPGRVVKTYRSNHKGVEIKTIELYTVTNEGTTYYTVNGEADDDFKIMS